MQYIASFRNQTAAEKIAYRIESFRVHTGMRGDKLSNGEQVYSLYISDRSMETLEESLPGLLCEVESDLVCKCPSCGSRAIHPQERDDSLDFSVLGEDSGPMQMICASCNHTWE